MKVKTFNEMMNESTETREPLEFISSIKSFCNEEISHSSELGELSLDTLIAIYELIENDITKEDILNEKKDKLWLTHIKEEGGIKKGLMHKMLGIAKDKNVSDVYTSGEELGTALINALKRKKGMSTEKARTKAFRMLNFAAITSKDGVFKSAANFVSKEKKEKED